MPQPIRPDALPVNMAEVKSKAVNPGRVKTGSIYAARCDAKESCDSCVWPPAEDEAIVSRLKARDESAFHTIVDRYASTVSRVASGITGNSGAAEEIAREVFARAYFAVPGLTGRTPLFPWIYRIAVEECYAFLNRRPLTEPIPHGIRNSERPGTHKSLINRLLAELPEDDRWILIAKEVEGISLSELSRVTGLDEQALRSKLFRVRQNLIAALRESEMAIDPCTM
jgi:RNA polymerase sigma-70 factor (ECF subfamily)